MNRKTIVTIIITALLVVAAPLFAAYDAFMKFDSSIPGESKAPGHEGWIEVYSFSFGATQAGAGYGSGGGAGKVAPRELTITKKMDSSSPKLMQAAMTGKHFQNVTLDLRGQRFLLEDVMITSVQQVPSGVGDGSVHQSIKMSFVRDVTHDSPVNANTAIKKYDKLSGNATINGGGTLGAPGTAMVRSVHIVPGQNRAIIVVCDVAGQSQGILIGLNRAAMTKQTLPQLTFAISSGGDYKNSKLQKADTPGVNFTFTNATLLGNLVNGDGCTQYSLNFTRFEGPSAGFDYLK